MSGINVGGKYTLKAFVKRLLNTVRMIKLPLVTTLCPTAPMSAEWSRAVAEEEHVCPSAETVRYMAHRPVK